MWSSIYSGACISALVYLAVSLAGAMLAVRVGDFYALPLPLLAGGLCGWVVAFLLLHRRMERLDSFLMC